MQEWPEDIEGGREAARGEAQQFLKPVKQRRADIPENWPVPLFMLVISLRGRGLVYPRSVLSREEGDGIST